MRPRRRLGSAEEEALKAAVRKAVEEEEMQRDAEFEEQCKRLLDQLDRFEKGAGRA